jgi:hypothetical protein
MTWLADIQKKMKVPKTHENKFSHYFYRNCEDIFEAFKALDLPVSLTIADEIILTGDRFYVKATATLQNASETLSVSAYAREPFDKKGMDEAQITGATSSYARKYALNGLFAIDDTKDADTLNTGAAPSQTNGNGPKTDLKAELLQDSTPAPEPAKTPNNAPEKGKNRIAFDTISNIYAAKPDTDKGKQKFRSFMKIYLAPRNCTVDDLSDSEIGILLEKMKGE